MPYKDPVKEKEYQKRYRAEWYVRNRERVAELSKAWAAANQDKVRQHQAVYLERHRERINERTRKTRAAHPRRVASDKEKAHRAEYRARNRARISEANKKWRDANQARTKEYWAEYYARNREHRKAQSRAQAKANPELRRQQLKRWKAANPDLVKERSRAWRQSHPGYGNERSRLWMKAHPEVGRLNASTRRAREANVEGRHSATEMENLFTQQEKLCANPMCRVRLTKTHGLPNSRHGDHIYPLRPHEPCVPHGTNYIENMWWLCRTCNLKKQSRNPLAWALENGFLLPDHPRMYGMTKSTVLTRDRQ